MIGGCITLHDTAPPGRNVPPYMGLQGCAGWDRQLANPLQMTVSLDGL